MSSSRSSLIARQLSFFLAMVVIGGLAGGAAGYVAAKTVAGGFDSQLSQLWSRVSTPVVQVTTTTPPAQIVPLEAPHQPVYPVAFVNRTASSLLPLKIGRAHV